MGHMKKAKSGARDSNAKHKGAAKTVDQYLARVQQPARGTLGKIRTAIRSAAPPATTEVISYGIPAFRHDAVVMWYAAFADHCSLFPTAAVIEACKKELKGYTLSKGTIQFPTDKPMPAALVKRLVKARLAQMEAKKHR
jgi:uncharacterized protein YdhG (YjbR/CyaY superfamily)